MAAAAPTAAPAEKGMGPNPFDRIGVLARSFTFEITGRKNALAFTAIWHGLVVRVFQEELDRIHATPEFAIFPVPPHVLSIVELLTGVSVDAFRPKSKSVVDKRQAYRLFLEAVVHSAPNIAGVDALPDVGGAKPPRRMPVFHHAFVKGSLAVPPPRHVKVEGGGASTWFGASSSSSSSPSSAEILTEPRTARELDVLMHSMENDKPTNWFNVSFERERLAVWIQTYPSVLLHNPDVDDKKQYLRRLYALLHEEIVAANEDIENVRTAIYERCVELARANETRPDVAWFKTLKEQQKAYEDGLIAPLQRRIDINEAQIKEYDAKRKSADADLGRLQHKIDELVAANDTLASELAAAKTVHGLFSLLPHLDPGLRDRAERFLDVQRATVATFKEATEKTSTSEDMAILLDRAELHMRRMQLDLARPIPPPDHRMLLAFVGLVQIVGR